MYISSWSGGKDSCLACYKAIKAGIKISHLVHFVREFNLHGVDAGMIRLQAELSGITIVQRKIVSDDFESEFKDTVKALIGNGIKGMVFGDIYLEPHKEWVDRVCRELGIEALEPLWGISTEKLLNDFIDEGFEAVLVSGQKKFIGREWIGRKADREFMEHLKTKPDVDICGENGEFHTFVTGGPLFKGRVEITKKEVTERDGYWFLDIKGHRVIK